MFDDLAEVFFAAANPSKTPFPVFLTSDSFIAPSRRYGSIWEVWY